MYAKLWNFKPIAKKIVCITAKAKKSEIVNAIIEKRINENYRT